MELELLESTSTTAGNFNSRLCGSDGGTSIRFHGGEVLLFPQEANSLHPFFSYVTDVASWYLDDVDVGKLPRPTIWEQIFNSGLDACIPSAKSQQAIAVDEIVDEATMLSRTRHYLGLNTSELAEVMQVERPTIYAWLQGGRIRRSNRERVVALYQIAAEWWNGNGIALGRYLHMKNAAGVSVFDLLRGATPATKEFTALFETAAMHCKDEKREQDNAFDSFEKRAVTHGFARVPEAVRRRSVNSLTRRKGTG